MIEKENELLECRVIIANNPETDLQYAKCIMKGRWHMGEEAISKIAQYSYYYAKNVIKEPWPKRQRDILNSI